MYNDSKKGKKLFRQQKFGRRKQFLLWSVETTNMISDNKPIYDRRSKLKMEYVLCEALYEFCLLLPHLATGQSEIDIISVYLFFSCCLPDCRHS